MTPEQVSVINAISQIMEKIGTMPVFSMILCVIVGPWVMAWLISRGQEKRFEAITKMYESNVKLVECYEEVARNLQDLVITNVQSMQAVKERADNNLFCPIVRRQSKQKEVDL